MTNKKNNCCAENPKICLRTFRRKMSPPILPNKHYGHSSVQSNYRNPQQKVCCVFLNKTMMNHY